MITKLIKLRGHSYPTQSNPIHGWIHSISNSVTYIVIPWRATDSYRGVQRNLRRRKMRYRNPWATKIMGGTKFTWQINVLMFISKML